MTQSYTKLDIVLAGVGGQGILTIANVLCEAAIRRKFYFKQAEVHGMSQRGGAVYSDLRISEKPVMSDLIPSGNADFLVSMEPLEVGRYLHYVNKNAWIVTSVNPVKNIDNYPAYEKVLENIFALPRVVAVDTENLALKAKNPRGQNIALVGVLAHFLPFSPEELTDGIRKLFAPKGAQVVESNLLVFEKGYALGKVYRELLAQNLSARDIYTTLQQRNWE